MNNYKCFFTFLVLLQTSSFQAQDFDMDFGINGVTVPVLNDSLVYFHHGNIEILEDNSILTSGWIFKVVEGQPVETGIGATKYTSNGSLDQTYGVGGTAYHPVANGSSFFYQHIFSDFSVDSENRALFSFKTIGSSEEPYGDWNMIKVLRFDDNGLIDSSFGDSGEMFIDSIPVGTSIDVFPSLESIDSESFAISYPTPDSDYFYQFRIYDIPSQSFTETEFIYPSLTTTFFRPYVLNFYEDALYLAAFQVTTGSDESGAETVIAKFGTDGMLDYSFGDEGIAIINTEAMNIDSALIPVSMSTDPSEAIYLLCQPWENDSLSQRYIAKVNPFGELESDYGNNGISEIPLFDVLNWYNDDALINCEEDLYFMTGFHGGQLSTPSSNLGIAKLDADGNFDTTFGDSGILELSEQPGSHESISIQKSMDGELLFNFTTSDQTTFARVGKLNDCIVSNLAPNLDPNELLVFPNPANSIISIEADRFVHNAQVSITNTSGSLVYFDDHSLPVTLDVSDFAPGIYYLNVQTSSSILGGNTLIVID